MMRTAASQFASLFLAVLLCAGPAWGKGVVPDGATASPGLSSTIALRQLPRHGQKTYRLIFSGGPFPYEKDGTVFGNRERLLPIMRRGYYREYTVKTFGVRHRGARRIVCGGLQPTRPDACYYTSDHYSSFKRIVEQ